MGGLVLIVWKNHNNEEKILSLESIVHDTHVDTCCQGDKLMASHSAYLCLVKEAVWRRRTINVLK